MVPPLHGDTTVLDKPEMWIGKSIEEIIHYRLSLIRGISDVSVYASSGNYIESLQELAMASKSAESEAMFEKMPITNIEHGKDLGESAPYGPTASLKSFKTYSLSIDRRLENVYYDTDLRAAEAVINLYRKEVDISSIHRVLSMGMLGLRKNRKLVPTRWSISAADDIISASLIREIDMYPTIDYFEVYKFSHLDNYYSVVLIPLTSWMFEMQEVWFDSAGNLGMGVDFEDAMGLDHYPRIAGAYFAARLAIAENLSKRRRKAAALVLREIRPEYTMPVGVWQIREGIRQALKKENGRFQGFESALHFACTNLSFSSKDWIRNGKIYKIVKEQMKMTDFFSNG